MRIWIDLTAPAHPVVFRPIVARLRSAGHEVDVTARDYAQTLALARRLGLEHRAVGMHGGAKRTRKLVSLVSRSLDLWRWARGRGFDLAVAHGSNDLAIVAKALRHRSTGWAVYFAVAIESHAGRILISRERRTRKGTAKWPKKRNTATGV